MLPGLIDGEKRNVETYDDALRAITQPAARHVVDRAARPVAAADRCRWKRGRPISSAPQPKPGSRSRVGLVALTPTAIDTNRFPHVMAGLVPAIHVFDACSDFKTWIPATSAGMTVIGTA
ncbi:MAG: hypothetical protein MZV49_22530 [Rhodopseudomonas palustris]|nr:hypothetical protein [Rhodopseudomonas palustris]